MINLFGITVEAPHIESGQYLDGILSAAAKKDSERQILRDFVIPRIGEIVDSAADEASTIGDPTEYRPQAQSFYLSHLKSSGAYEQMTLKVISSDPDFKSSKTATQILSGKKVPLPPTFPGDHKKAESLVQGSLSSAIGDSECREYLIRFKVKEKVQKIAKNLFFSLKNGLDLKQSHQFMSVSYELDKLKAADFTNEPQIKRNIVRSIQTGEFLKIGHIKCLRFTYPGGNHLKLLTHVDADTNQDNHSRRPQSERPIFANLQKLDSVFIQNGIDTDFRILVSDQDLIDYFPEGGEGIIPDSDISQASYDIHEYQESVAAESPFASTTLLRSHLRQEDKLEEFHAIRQNNIRELELSGGTPAVANGYVGEKIRYRIESNRKIFTKDPGEPFAQKRVYSQVASLQALSVLGNDMILVEEDHGNDNQYIGGRGKNALPVIFIDLKG